MFRYIFCNFHLIFILQLIIFTVANKDYCKSKKCGYTHIGCRNDGQFKSNCPLNAEIVDLNLYKELILREHNFLRNDVASGKYPLLPAARMAEMQWDNELAFLAQLNVMDCKLSHDKCRNTDSFYYSGQNTALYAYTDTTYDNATELLIKERIADWASEIKYATIKDLYKYTSKNLAGHFTVMVADRNNFVGCGAVRYMISDFSYFLMTCNYATNNFLGLPTYKTGQPTSACKTGKSLIYPHLCHPNEVYKVLE